MNSRNLFKLIIILWSWIKYTAILFPLCFAFVSLKQGNLQYGYDFFEIDYRWALMIAIGLSMVLTAWNVLEFDKLPDNDLKYYLKGKQRMYYQFVGKPTEAEISNAVEEFANENRKWKLVSSSSERWQLKKVNPYFINDKSTITLVKGGLEINSGPQLGSWIMDLGRNFKHIVNLGTFFKKRAL